MEFLDPKLQSYAEGHTASEPAVLAELNRETNVNVLMPRMLSGHLQGQFLQLVSHMIKPEKILEIGTYTGYSAICLAAGLKEGGKLHTIDINEELEEMITRYFRKAGVTEKIHLHIGNALEIIPAMNEVFDLVFIDADKINYLNYYNLVIDKVSMGGFIIADNVLWSGRVLTEKQQADKDTLAIMEFNDFVHRDSRVENVLLPVRDGLMILRKK